MESTVILNSELVQRLQSIRDYRSARGKRYPLWVRLLVSVLGVMSGAQGYKALEDFGIRHYQALCDYLGVALKRLPSDTTLRRMFRQVSLDELTAVFEGWARGQFPAGEGECLSVDGKSLRATFTGHSDASQNFVGIVSVYSHQHRMAIAQQDYQNKLESEISVVQHLLETLGLSGVTFTFDALHCQKNASVASRPGQ